MSPTEKYPGDESTPTDVSKLTGINVKNVELPPSSQPSSPSFKTIPIHMRKSLPEPPPPILKPIPIHTHISGTGTSLLKTTTVVSPEKPKPIPRSAAIAINGASDARTVVIKLETTVQSIDSEHIKSGQKRKPVENSTLVSKKKLVKRDLDNIDFMDPNDVKAVYVQSDTSGKNLTEHIALLKAVLTFHTVVRLKVLYKSYDISKTPSTAKGDLINDLIEIIMRKRDILRQDRIHSSTVTKNP